MTTTAAAKAAPPATATTKASASAAATAAAVDVAAATAELNIVNAYDNTISKKNVTTQSAAADDVCRQRLLLRRCRCRRWR